MWAHRKKCAQTAHKGVLIIRLLIRRGVVNLTFSRHCIILQVFIVGGNLVNHAAVRQKLNDSVGCGLDYLVVTAGEQYHAREFDHTVV